jgi:translation initiation factor IF-3
LRISDHDFKTKVNQAQRFLQKKHKVKVSLELKGREITRQDLGKNILERFSSELIDYSQIEQSPAREMNTLIMVLAPK